MNTRNDLQERGSAATIVIILLSIFIIGGGIAIWLFFFFLPELQNERARRHLEEIRESTPTETPVAEQEITDMQVCTFSDGGNEIHIYLHGPRIRLAELPNGTADGALVYIYDGQLLAVYDTTESPAGWRRGSEESAKALIDRTDIYRNNPDIECAEESFDAMIFRRQEDPVAQELE